jgi:hypothetical protein
MGVTRARHEVCMSDYEFTPQENMTNEEIVAILSMMLEFSAFYYPPHGAERHFKEIVVPETKKKLVLDGLKGVFKL